MEIEQKKSDPTAEKPPIGSIRELIDTITGKSLPALDAAEDAGFAEVMPFPFMAIVGQKELKLGLVLSLINPLVGGVLLIGPRGTGKTTSVRSLVNLLPAVRHSRCHYGCLEEDIELGGVDAVCPACAEKYAQGEKLHLIEPVRLVELPLNATLDDVVGGVNDAEELHERMKIKRGILSYADRSLLYVDEVNLLPDMIVDAILDASAQGQYTVRRGNFSAVYRSRFTLVGTMNPEEGNLRPQILDRFGLRLLVKGLEDSDERLSAYQWAQAYLRSPRTVVNHYSEETEYIRREIQEARSRLAQVELPDDVAQLGLKLIKTFGIASLRAEITLFEAAKAYAAADSRLTVTKEDLAAVAPMALRLRRSSFIQQYFKDQSDEEQEIETAIRKMNENEAL